MNPSIYYSLLLFGVVYGQLRSPEITEHPTDLLVPKGAPATLNCKAEGRPKPQITWFKDGKEFRSKEDRHVLLKNGDLFFLRVWLTKEKNDSGVYWCQATNEVASVRSKNASLEIAMLSDQFEEEPSAVRVAEGKTALLRCAPPKGHPQPVVVWSKDGKELNPASLHRLKIVDQGSLVISGVRMSDSGDYVCKARNVYGMKESRSAHLSVSIPPHLVSTSPNITGTSESTIEMMCRVGGQPPPEVFWVKVSGGELPIGRMSQEEGGQVLKIMHVTPQDQGVYSCRAENPIGTVSANISLTIHSRPVVTVTPIEGRVAVNGTASFTCEVSGYPPPTVFWTHEGTGMIAGMGNDRIFLDSSHTLTLRQATKDDRGFYVCSAVGVSGSAMSRAHLEVQSVDDMPPPLIALGAPNQTLPIGTEGEMPCEARGTPEPKVSWFDGDQPLKQTARATISPLGTLRIIRLKASDSGIYTCKATSASGTSIWVSSLIVAKPTNPNVAFFKMRSDTALPEPPPHLRVLSINSTSVTLGWRRGLSGASPILGYSVQMWSPDERYPWSNSPIQMFSPATMSLGATVTELKPDTRYLFVVRARNHYGVSRPSEMTPVVRTLSSSLSKSVNLMDIRMKLSTPSVVLTSVEAVSSSSISVKWRLLVDPSLLDGIYIRYRPTKASIEALSVEPIFLRPDTFTPADKRVPSSHVVSGLLPSTEYEVFITPFFGDIEGQPSSAMRFNTLESVPNVSPTGLSYSIINSTSVRFFWDAVSPHLANGKVVGYVFQVVDVSVGAKELLVNKSVTAPYVVLNNLVPGASYHASVLALTARGGGPHSKPLKLSLPKSGDEGGEAGVEETTTASSDFAAVTVNKNYYLVAGIAAASIVIFFFLFAAVVFIYRHRRKSKGNPYFGKSESKDPWCEYPDCWNDTCKSIGGGADTGNTNHSMHSYTNSKPLSKPTSPFSRTRFPNHDSHHDLYKIKPTEVEYEDPDGLRLVSFAKLNNKRCFSPEPYATTPLIAESHYRGSIKSGKDFPPNIPLGTPMDHRRHDDHPTCPDLLTPQSRLTNFVNCNDSDGGPAFMPTFHFPPPPQSEAPDPTLSFNRRNDVGFTRFLQQQLPYSFVGSSFGGSSSGGSQKSHESPQVGGRMPQNRLIPHQELSLVVDPRMDAFHESLFARAKNNNSDASCPRGPSVTHGFPAPPKSFEGEGYSQPFPLDEVKDANESTTSSSCCSSSAYRSNFGEETTTSSPWGPQCRCSNDDLRSGCADHQMFHCTSSGRPTRLASHKKSKLPKAGEGGLVESVTSPLI